MGEYREQIENFFKENFSQYKLTKANINLLEEQLETSLNNRSLSEIFETWTQEPMAKYIKNTQPEISRVGECVQNNITEYFKEYLPNYIPISVCRCSNHKEDAALYAVVAKNVKNNEIAVWTSWNEKTQSLNRGHYNLTTIDEAEEIIRDNFYDITMEMDKYGPEQSQVEFEVEREEKEEDNNIIDFNEYKSR